MTRRGSLLAARLKAGIDHKISEERRQKEALRRKEEEDQALRKALLADLRAFAKDVGHFAVTPAPDGGLRIGYNNRDVVFTPDGNHTDVVVTGTDLEGTMIQFEQTLQTWVLRRTRHGKRESVVFFDQGLEILLRLALNISPLSEPPTSPTGRVL